jgi:hypothetical protein
VTKDQLLDASWQQHRRHTVGVHDCDPFPCSRSASATTASLELELMALRHQVIVLRRQRPRRLRLFLTDRSFWVWLN